MSGKQVEKGSVVTPDVHESGTEKQPDVQTSGMEKQPDVLKSGTEKQPNITVPTPMAENQGRTCESEGDADFVLVGRKHKFTASQKGKQQAKEQQSHKDVSPPLPPAIDANVAGKVPIPAVGNDMIPQPYHGHKGGEVVECQQIQQGAEIERAFLEVTKKKNKQKAKSVAALPTPKTCFTFEPQGLVVAFSFESSDNVHSIHTNCKQTLAE
ncbi:Uncharacterized protein Fot_03968 [Forsythia ovata]|uniref:Uncharacterized protein n=1 Tax=Forsythia ovata TaxID=205694 RepID=A0ABD1XB76_9LAMI